jgi:exopolyphosphatase/pppGpp-phosphohydrolase
VPGAREGADLIVAGVAIVEATLERWRLDALIVSDWSLREGLLAEVAAGEV